MNLLHLAILIVAIGITFALIRHGWPKGLFSWNESTEVNESEKDDGDEWKQG